MLKTVQERKKAMKTKTNKPEPLFRWKACIDNTRQKYKRQSEHVVWFQCADYDTRASFLVSCGFTTLSPYHSCHPGMPSSLVSWNFQFCFCAM
jgi:hypothetical protein